MILICFLHPAAMASHTSELREHVLWRIFIRRYGLIAHTPAQKTPEEDSGGSFTKIRDPLSKGSSPLCLEHASKEARPEPPSSVHFNENDKGP